MAGKGREIATAYVNIQPYTKGFGRAMSKDIRAGLGDMSNFGKRTGGLFRAGFAGGIGGAIGNVITRAIGAGISSIKTMVQNFSNLEDAVQASQVTFGKSFSKISSFAKTSARAFGMSKTQVIDASIQFGAFGKAAGFSGKKLASFSTDMSKLAADLASFRGGTVDEAITAIGAAFRGEELPMRRYGVLVSENAVRQKAFEMGLVSTTSKALEPQARTLAVQALLLEKTKDAQGDFARSAVSTQNTFKTFTATLNDFTAQAGGVFAPLFSMGARIGTEVLGALSNSFINISKKSDTVFKRMRASLEVFLTGKVDRNVFKALNVDINSIKVDRILHLRDKCKKLFTDIKTTISQIFAPAIRKVSKTLKEADMSFATFGTISPIMAVFKAISANAPAIGEILGVLAQTMVRSFTTVAPTIGIIISTFMNVASALLPVITPIVKIICDLNLALTNLITPLITCKPLVIALSGAFASFKIGQKIFTGFKAFQKTEIGRAHV